MSPISQRAIATTAMALAVVMVMSALNPLAVSPLMGSLEVGLVGVAGLALVLWKVPGWRVTQGGLYVLVGCSGLFALPAGGGWVLVTAFGLGTAAVLAGSLSVAIRQLGASGGWAGAAIAAAWAIMEWFAPAELFVLQSTGWVGALVAAGVFAGLAFGIPKLLSALERLPAGDDSAQPAPAVQDLSPASLGLWALWTGLSAGVLLLLLHMDWNTGVSGGGGFPVPWRYLSVVALFAFAALHYFRVRISISTAFVGLTLVGFLNIFLQGRLVPTWPLAELVAIGSASLHSLLSLLLPMLWLGAVSSGVRQGRAGIVSVLFFAAVGPGRPWLDDLLAFGPHTLGPFGMLPLSLTLFAVAFAGYLIILSLIWKFQGEG